MSKILSFGLLAALGLTLATTDAQAIGRRKKKQQGCCQDVPVATVGYGGYGGGGCGGCGGGGYGMVGGQQYGYAMDGQPGTYMAGQSGVYMNGQPGAYGYGQPVPMPGMPMPSTGVIPTSGTTGGTSGASTGGTTGATTGKPGTITIMVPNADTQVWFEDTALPQTGKERTFNTPALTEGKSYNYTVRAKWTDSNGKAMEKSLPVSVKAGQTSTVDFVK